MTPFIIPAAWMPDVPVEAIVNHWTGGAYGISALDRADYHFIIDGDGNVVRGNHSIADNVPPLRDGQYAPHTKSFNGHKGKAVIGISVCGMLNATETPFKPGRYPITRLQIERQVDLNAQLCIRFGLPVTPQTILQHGEVQKNRGIKQNGKWDVCRLPFAPGLTSVQVCNQFRAEVAARVVGITTPTKLPRLLLYVDGSGPTPVPGAAYNKNNFSWTVNAGVLNQILGTKLAGGVGPLRGCLESAGYSIDEINSQRGSQHLSNLSDPRHYVFITRKK